MATLSTRPRYTPKHIPFSRGWLVLLGAVAAWLALYGLGELARLLIGGAL